MVGAHLSHHRRRQPRLGQPIGLPSPAAHQHLHQHRHLRPAPCRGGRYGHQVVGHVQGVGAQRAGQAPSDDVQMPPQPHPSARRQVGVGKELVQAVAAQQQFVNRVVAEGRPLPRGGAEHLGRQFRLGHHPECRQGLAGLVVHHPVNTRLVETFDHQPGLHAHAKEGTLAPRPRDGPHVGDQPHVHRAIHRAQPTRRARQVADRLRPTSCERAEGLPKRALRVVPPQIVQSVETWHLECRAQQPTNLFEVLLPGAWHRLGDLLAVVHHLINVAPPAGRYP